MSHTGDWRHGSGQSTSSRNDYLDPQIVHVRLALLNPMATFTRQFFLFPQVSLIFCIIVQLSNDIKATYRNTSECGTNLVLISLLLGPERHLFAKKQKQKKPHKWALNMFCLLHYTFKSGFCVVWKLRYNGGNGISCCVNAATAQVPRSITSQSLEIVIFCISRGCWVL